MNDGIPEVRECMEGGSDAERKPLLPPCRICRGKASGCHYGVISCEACKGFFRRCLRTKNELKCAADNDCTFQRGSRTNCSACRFRLCEQQGMSKQAIKTGRYTSTRRSQYIKEVKLEAHTAGSTGINEEENSPPTADPIRNALECQDVPRVLHYDSLVSDLLQALSRSIEGDLDSFLNNLKMESRKNDYFVQMMLENTRQEEKNNNTERLEQMKMVADHMNTQLPLIVSFVKLIPGWRIINMQDQIGLLRESILEYWLLSHFQCMDDNLKVFTGEFNTSYRDSVPIYSDEYLECLYRTAALFKTLKLTKEEIVVLKTIVLTFTDRCELRDRERVEKIQLQMIDCYKYICQLQGRNFNKRFATVISKLLQARILSEKFKDIVKTVVSHWEVLKHYPLLSEFYSGYV